LDQTDPEGEDVIAAFASVAAALTLWALVQSRARDPVVGERVAHLTGEAVRVERKRRRPGRSTLDRLGKRVPADRPAIAATIVAAGASLTPDEFAGLRALGAFFGVLAGTRFGALGALLIPALGFAGYIAPDAFLRARIRSRKDEIASALPDVVDLMAVCAQAGLNIPLMLKRVAERAPGVLGEELRTSLQEIDLGVPRKQALAALAEKNRLPEMDSLVGALVSSERFGTSIASSLPALATDIRNKRRHHAEEQARRAPIKMLFPLVFLILPAFVLLTVVPLLLGTFQSLGF
jgi:tight adherence protein C